LKVKVDRFFDEVMVNADDEAVRTNRQLLVARVVESVRQVADFSAIH
jgi:glycyl-tRNA synthetase beta chain